MTELIIPSAVPNPALAPVQSDRPEALDVEWCAERASEALAYLADFYPECAASEALHPFQDAAHGYMRGVSLRADWESRAGLTLNHSIVRFAGNSERPEPSEPKNGKSLYNTSHEATPFKKGFERYRGGSDGGHRWRGVRLLTFWKAAISRDSDPSDVKWIIDSKNQDSHEVNGKTRSEGSERSVVGDFEECPHGVMGGCEACR